MCAQMWRKDPLYTKVNSSQYDWARVQEVLVVDAITWNHPSMNGNIHTVAGVDPTTGYILHFHAPNRQRLGMKLLQTTIALTAVCGRYPRGKPSSPSYTA